jgi:hypothetical protein
MMISLTLDNIAFS